MTRRLTFHDWIILAGTALVAFGVFLPIAQAPVLGTLTYFNGGKGIGVYVLVLSIVTAALVMCGYRLFAPYVGAVIGFLAVTSLLRISGAFAEALVKYTQLSSGPAGWVADTFAANTNLGWGWLPLIGGAALIVGGGFTAPVLRSAQRSVMDDDLTGSIEEVHPDVSNSFYERKLSPVGNSGSPQASKKTFGRRQPSGRNQPPAH